MENLSIASAITLSSIALGFFGSIIVAMIKYIKPKSKNSNSNNKFIDEKFCDERHKSINDSMDRIDNNIKRIFEILDSK